MSERELPEWVRKRAHEELDEILDLYRDGAPLRLTQHLGWHTPIGDSAQIRFEIKKPDWP